MNCSICGKQVKFNKKKNCYDGVVCGDCLDKASELFIKQSKDLSVSEVELAISYAQKNMEQFSETSSYGDLHIDESHGLFAICKHLDANGKPTGNNVFSIYDLSSVSLCCKTPFVNKEQVYSDIEFSCFLENIRLSIKKTIKKRVKCTSKRVNPKEIQWGYPSDMEMFRTMFNYMLSGASQKINDILCGKTVYQYEVERAEALFMLPAGYDKKDLDRARALLLKVYSTDENNCQREVDIIKKSYQLLLTNLYRTQSREAR